jgi:hypothetical protein
MSQWAKTVKFEPVNNRASVDDGQMVEASNIVKQHKTKSRNVKSGSGNNGSAIDD